MPKFLHIQSSLDGKLIVDNHTITISDQCIHLSTNGNIYARFEPTNKDVGPILVYIPIQSNTACQVIPYSGEHYDVILSPHLIIGNNYSPINTKTMGRLTINCYNNSNNMYINVLLDNEIKQTVVTPILGDVDIILNSFIFIVGTLHNSPYIVAINDDFEVVLNNQCVELEQTNSQVTALIDLQTVAGHGKVYQFDINQNIVTNYLVYLHGEQLNITDTRLIPLCMLQALKIGDDKLATSLMANNANIDKLHNYFGPITQAYLNTYNTDSINYTVFGNSIKSYDFELDGNKIADIDERPLQL